MEAFIKKHEFNYICKCLFDLNSTFRNCSDPLILATTKAHIQNKILNKFTNLTEDQKSILDIDKIIDPIQIDGYLKELDSYVYGMPKISSVALSKLFRKEKKLKLPKLNEDSKLVYLGWIDPGIKKLLIAYNLNGKLVGMSCRLSETNTSTANVCTLCNHIASENDVAFVSPICKTSSSNLDAYKSIGFHICLDSKKCNERITSTEKLEELLKEVNNIKWYYF